MTGVTHAFVAPIGDDPAALAAGEVTPQSHWNAQHVLTGIRSQLTANTNYYVAIGGSDSNPGTLAQPFATIQHAVTIIAQTVDFAAFTLTLNVGAGTFAGCQIPYFDGGGTFKLLGAGSTSTIITSNLVGGDTSGLSLFVFTSPSITFDKIGLKATPNPGGGPAQIVCYAAGVTVQAGVTDFRYTPSGGEPCFLIGAPAFGLISGAITIDGSAQAGTFTSAVNVFYDGAVQDFATYTFVNSPNFGNNNAGGFVNLSNGGIYQSFGSVPAVTGQVLVAVLGGASSGIPTTGSSPSFIDYSSSYNSILGTNLTYPQSTTALRTVLTANTSFFVATTGSDSNNGSSTSPWATLQHAADFIRANLDGGKFTITVNIGAGTFVGVNYGSSFSFVTFLGAGSAQTTLTNSNGPNKGCIETFGNISADKVHLSDTGNAYWWISDGGGLNQFLGDINFSASDVLLTTTTSTNGISVAGPGGCLFLTAPGFTVSNAGGGTINTVLLPSLQGQIQDYSGFTITGTPAWGIAFIHATGAGLYVKGNTTAPSGASTGKRFQSDGSSNISPGFNGTGFFGPTFFPGSTAGTVDASSFYDGFPGPLPGIDTQTGASYTLVIGDAFEIVEMNNAGANTLTVPPQSSVNFEIGTKIQVTQTGAGATTIAAGAGVTIHNVGVVGGQWKSAQLYKRGTDEWVQTVA